MRYGVNLYPERGVRRRDLRRGALRGLIVGVPLGLVILTLGFLIAGGVRTTREASAVEASLIRLRAAAVPAPQEGRDDEAWKVVARRGDRIDWTLLLCEMSRAMSDEVSLTEIRGIGEGRGDVARRLVLVGHLSEGTENLAPILGLIDSLRAAPEMSADFPVVALETAKTSAWVDFQITGGVTGAAP